MPKICQKITKKVVFFSFEMHLYIFQNSCEFYVPEVLNVHVNESRKKSTFFRKIFFPNSEKLTFEKENMIFQNIFSNFNLFY